MTSHPIFRRRITADGAGKPASADDGAFSEYAADNPAGFSPDLLMGMLNPEQKEMFQTYDAMFSDNNESNGFYNF